MRAYRSLRRQGDFTRMYRRAKRFTGRGFILYASRITRAGQISKIGVSVSKAVGNAVHRNLVRRRVQCIFDALGPQSYDRLDMLVVAKPGAAELSFAVLSSDLDAAVGEARRVVT